MCHPVLVHADDASTRWLAVTLALIPLAGRDRRWAWLTIERPGRRELHALARTRICNRRVYAQRLQPSGCHVAVAASNLERRTE